MYAAYAVLSRCRCHCHHSFTLSLSLSLSFIHSLFLFHLPLCILFRCPQTQESYGFCLHLACGAPTFQWATCDSKWACPLLGRRRATLAAMCLVSPAPGQYSCIMKTILEIKNQNQNQISCRESESLPASSMMGVQFWPMTSCGLNPVSLQ